MNIPPYSSASFENDALTIRQCPRRGSVKASQQWWS